MKAEAVAGRMLLDRNGRGRGQSLMNDSLQVMKQAGHLQLDPLHVIIAVLHDPSTYVYPAQLLGAYSLTLKKATSSLDLYTGLRVPPTQPFHVEFYTLEIEAVFARLPKKFEKWVSQQSPSQVLGADPNDEWPGALRFTECCVEADAITIRALGLGPGALKRRG